MEGIIRRKYKVYGRVQGVGFRYRAKACADSIGVTGYVENMEDGTVEMEAQGSERELHELFAGINRSSYIVMERIESKDISLQEEERGFRIVRDW